MQCFPSISVIVPTYKRAKDLERCLAALDAQTVRVHEVIVVYREDDIETEKVLRIFHANTSLTIVFAHPPIPGVVAAMNAGLDIATSDIIAITDDDAMPRKDWLEHIAAHFVADPTLAGVGGRDFLYVDGNLVSGQESVVGKLRWFGRTIHGHHLGVGGSREVDYLKGVNMSYRRASIKGFRFDTRLKGSGAQVHCEMAFCLALRRVGQRLVYDPKIIVDHFTAPRHDVDQRTFNSEALTNATHNETLALLEYMSSLQRIAFLIWAVSVGSKWSPGLAQGVRLKLLGISHPLQRTRAALCGRWLGWCTWRQSNDIHSR
jgi:glycosyltransferase involved in cell wall biosynthesis